MTIKRADIKSIQIKGLQRVEQGTTKKKQEEQEEEEGGEKEEEEEEADG